MMGLLNFGKTVRQIAPAGQVRVLKAATSEACRDIGRCTSNLTLVSAHTFLLTLVCAALGGVVLADRQKSKCM